MNNDTFMRDAYEVIKICQALSANAKAPTQMTYYDTPPCSLLRVTPSPSLITMNCSLFSLFYSIYPLYWINNILFYPVQRIYWIKLVEASEECVVRLWTAMYIRRMLQGASLHS